MARVGQGVWREERASGERREVLTELVRQSNVDPRAFDTGMQSQACHSHMQYIQKVTRDEPSGIKNGMFAVCGTIPEAYIYQTGELLALATGSSAAVGICESHATAAHCKEGTRILRAVYNRARCQARDLSGQEATVFVLPNVHTTCLSGSELLDGYPRMHLDALERQPTCDIADALRASWLSSDGPRRLLDLALALKVLAVDQVRNLVVILAVLLLAFALTALLQALVALSQFPETSQRVGAELVEDARDQLR